MPWLKNLKACLSFTDVNKKVYELDIFQTFEKFIKDIRSKNITIDEKEIKQNKFAQKLDESRACPARGSKYICLWIFKNGKLLLSKKNDTKTDSSEKQTDVLDTFK